MRDPLTPLSSEALGQHLLGLIDIFAGDTVECSRGRVRFVVLPCGLIGAAGAGAVLGAALG